jgi:hypothetical protein
MQTSHVEVPSGRIVVLAPTISFLPNNSISKYDGVT